MGLAEPGQWEVLGALVGCGVIRRTARAVVNMRELDTRANGTAQDGACTLRACAVECGGAKILAPL